VLDNVIDNALKYAPSATALTIAASGRSGSVVIRVIDQGIGIPVGEREKVFEKFYRRPGVIGGGSGLGLAIARRVVADHHGTITLTDSHPQGTTVEIALPIAGA
jgi:signal transduction histidine kinase